MTKTVCRRILSFDVGSRNLSFAIIRLQTEIDIDPQTKNEYVCNDPWTTLEIEHWECIDILTECGCKRKNSKSLSAQVLSGFIIKCLWNRKHWMENSHDDNSTDVYYPLTDIIVELQPLRRGFGGGGGGGAGSAKNKILGQTILNFYTCWFLHHPQAATTVTTSTTAAATTTTHNQHQYPVITNVNAKMKLFVDPSKEFYNFSTVSQFANNNNTTTTATDSKNNYKQRKSRGIELTHQVIEKLCKTNNTKNNNKYSLYFHHYKSKKDDLADSLLQSIAYAQSNPPKLKKSRQRKKRKAVNNK